MSSDVISVKVILTDRAAPRIRFATLYRILKPEANTTRLSPRQCANIRYLSLTPSLPNIPQSQKLRRKRHALLLTMHDALAYFPTRIKPNPFAKQFRPAGRKR